MTTAGRGVRSVEVGAHLLDVLAHHSEPLMLRDLARKAGIAPAQAHTYLASLRALDLVEQEPASSRYRLGPAALELGIARMRSIDPIRLAQATAVALSEETGLAVALVVWGSFGPTVIQVIEGPDQIHINTRAGTVYSLTGTASGRVFAAHLPEAMVEKALADEKRERGQTNRVGTPSALSKAERQRIRDLGFATVSPPPVPSVNALAAPVFDHAGQIQMTITLIGAASMLDNSEESAFLAPLSEAALTISRGLGYEPAGDIAE